MHFTIGTRKSQLAIIQAEIVLKLLSELHPTVTFSILGMTTTGDEILDVALSKIGTKSLFTKELEIALNENTVDLVVHSLKDLPTTLPPGMVLGAVLEREDPRDAVVMSKKYAGFTLETLPPNSVIGTSSVRRSAQLKRKYPHLIFQDVRGNLNTRLKKLDDSESPYCALLLAYAGLHRLGWDERISQILSQDILLHAVGQGAIGIECRKDDKNVLELLRVLDHNHTRIRVTAEREFMKVLEGGCSVPLGVYSDYKVTLEEGKTKRSLLLTGSVTSLDGKEQILEREYSELSTENALMDECVDDGYEWACNLGRNLAESCLKKGAKKLLQEIKKE